jgi:hypothetical protein
MTAKDQDPTIPEADVMGRGYDVRDSNYADSSELKSIPLFDPKLLDGQWKSYDTTKTIDGRTYAVPGYMNCDSVKSQTEAVKKRTTTSPCGRSTARASRSRAGR